MKLLPALPLAALLLFSGCVSQPAALRPPAPIVIKTMNGEQRLVEQTPISDLRSGDEVIVRQGAQFIIATVGSSRGQGVHRLRWPHSDEMKLLSTENYAGRLFVMPTWVAPAPAAVAAAELLDAPEPR